MRAGNDCFVKSTMGGALCGFYGRRQHVLQSSSADMRQLNGRARCSDKVWYHSDGGIR